MNNDNDGKNKFVHSEHDLKEVVKEKEIKPKKKLNKNQKTVLDPSPDSDSLSINWLKQDLWCMFNTEVNQKFVLYKFQSSNFQNSTL